MTWRCRPRPGTVQGKSAAQHLKVRGRRTVGIIRSPIRTTVSPGSAPRRYPTLYRVPLQVIGPLEGTRIWIPVQAELAARQRGF